MTIHWSAEARRQFRAIIEYISNDSPLRATAYAAKIELKIIRLARFPLSGRLVPELKNEPRPPREIIIDDYRLVYQIHNKGVEITHFFHGRRRFPSLSEFNAGDA